MEASQNTPVISVKNLGVFTTLLLVVFYLPPTLLWFGVIPFMYRFHVLVLMTIVMVAYSVGLRRSPFELGFRWDNLKDSIIWNGILSSLFLLLLFILFFLGLIREPTVPDWNLFFVFYVFVSSPSQEFLYRSLLFCEMNRRGIKQAFAQIAISAVTFCYLHVFYNDLITIAVGLFMGAVWGVVYYFRPNFWGVAISHAILGAISIALGLI